MLRALIVVVLLAGAAVMDETMAETPSAPPNLKVNKEGKFLLQSSPPSHNAPLHHKKGADLSRTKEQGMPSSIYQHSPSPRIIIIQPDEEDAQSARGAHDEEAALLRFRLQQKLLDRLNDDPGSVELNLSPGLRAGREAGASELDDLLEFQMQQKVLKEFEGLERIGVRP